MLVEKKIIGNILGIYEKLIIWLDSSASYLIDLNSTRNELHFQKKKAIHVQNNIKFTLKMYLI